MGLISPIYLSVVSTKALFKVYSLFKVETGWLTSVFVGVWFSENQGRNLIEFSKSVFDRLESLPLTLNDLYGKSR